MYSSHVQAITIRNDRSEIAVDMLLTIVTVYPNPRRRRRGADGRSDGGGGQGSSMWMSAVERELPELELAGVRRKNM